MRKWIEKIKDYFYFKKIERQFSINGKVSDRIKDNFKKHKVVLIVLCCVWIAIVIVTLNLYKGTLGKQSYGSEEFDQLCNLSSSTIVNEIVSVKDGTEVVCVKVTTQARNNKGNATINIYGDTSKKLYGTKTFNVGTIKDNDSFVVVALDEIIDIKKDSTIRVELSSDSSDDKCIGVFYSGNKVFENSVLKINNEIIEGDLTLRFLTKGESLKQFYIIMITWIIFSISIVVFLVLFLEPKKEILFMFIALLFGITFVFIMTPMSPPDETTHYYYSLQVSNMMMGNFKNHQLIDAKYGDFDAFGGHINVSAAYERLMREFSHDLHLKGTNLEMPDIDWRYKIPFIPQAIGISIARFFNMNMLKTFYLGRFTNLLFYCLCVYIAIKTTPIHKTLYGMLSTLPIILQQSSSFSYDSFITGMCFVVVSYGLKWIFDDSEMTIKELIFVFICCLALAPAKVVYSFLIFVFLFSSDKRFYTNRQKNIAVLIVIIPAIWQIVALVSPYLQKLYYDFLELIVYNRDIKGINIAQINKVNFNDVSVGDFVRRPLDILGIYYRSIRDNLKTWLYCSVGLAMSGESLVLPTITVQIMLILLTLAALRKEKYIEPINLKVFMLLICAIVGVFTLTGMLLDWTDVVSEENLDLTEMVIHGVQGRYFSPLLPFVFPVFNNQKIRISERFDKYIIFAYVVLVFEIMVYILSYTFIN